MSIRTRDSPTSDVDDKNELEHHELSANHRLT